MQKAEFTQPNAPPTDFSEEGTLGRTTSSTGAAGGQEQGQQDPSFSQTKQDATATVLEEADSAYRTAVATGKRVGETIAGEAKAMISETVDEAKGQVKAAFSDQKGKAAESLDHVAGALRRTSEALSSGEEQTIAQYAQAAADQVERFSGYLKNHEVGELVNDLRDVARRQPELFVAGALAAGFLIGRFLKSSGAQTRGSRDNQGGASGYANDYGQPSTSGVQAGRQAGSTQYGGSSPAGTTWAQSRPSPTPDRPMTPTEEPYGR